MRLRIPARALPPMFLLWLCACQQHAAGTGPARARVAAPAREAAAPERRDAGARCTEATAERSEVTRAALEPGRGQVVATIGPTTLTTGELEARLNQQNPFVRSRYTSAERKQEFLDDQVRFELLAQEALRRGYDRDPEISRSIKKILVQRLVQVEFEDRVKLTDVTDAEIRAYYDSHYDDFSKPEMIRTSHIFVPFGADKEAARATAAAARREAASNLEDREHFKALVAKYSQEEESKRQGGDLRYLSAEDFESRFGTAAKDAVWATEEKNDVTGVVEGPDGFHVFKRTGRRKPIERSVSQVRDVIRNRLFREKRTEAFDLFVEALKDDFGVTTFPERLVDVKVETEGAARRHDSR